jgi:putative transcriptional regulator
VKTKLREYRARHGLTQEELAKKVGVRRETIVFLEKGKYNPSLFLAYRIAKALQTSIEEIFTFDEDESKLEEHHEHHKRSYIP